MSISHEAQQSEIAGSYTSQQQLFIRYFTAILIDLTVLNLFDEYWDYVVIESFTISLYAALLLQVLLQITLRIEHRIAAFFKARAGTTAKVMRVVSAWAVLFGSKFVILEALNIAFGDQVLFRGPYHGIVAFIAVIVVMLLAELTVVRFNKRLG